MTPTSKKLFDTFDEAALHYGWMEEEGLGPMLAKAKIDYETSKQALIAHITRYEADALAYFVYLEGIIK
jgi:hypothetical protein